MSSPGKYISRFLRFSCLMAVLFFSMKETQAQTDTNSILAPPTIEEIRDYEEEEQQPFVTADTPVLRNVPIPVVDSLKKLKVFEYANDPEYWIKEKKKETKYRKGFWDYVADLFSNAVFRTLMFIIFGGILLWALYKIIISNNLFLFNNRNKKLREEADEADIQLEEATLEDKIRLLIAEKNYRPAIRYLYIRVLQDLNERGWINYNSRATNYDYLRQMGAHSLGCGFPFPYPGV